MMHILFNQFFKLRQCVFLTVRRKSRNNGNLCPDEEAHFVAQRIEFLCLLIVGKTKGVRADLFDEIEILFVLFDGKSVA